MARNHSLTNAWQEHTLYGKPHAQHEYSPKDTLIHLMLCGCACLVIWIAWTLPPSPRGYGTHQQLGLPACTFHTLTGWPCPSCGLTTSFAHAAKLESSKAFLVQPFGFLAFWLTVLSIPLLLCLTALHIPLRKLIFQKQGLAVIFALLFLYSLGWIYKLATW